MQEEMERKAVAISVKAGKLTADLLKKDTTSQPPRYLVFFKSKDADALTAAFAEYSGKVVKRQAQAKPSIRRQLVQLQEVVKKMAQSLSRNKQQEVAR